MERGHRGETRFGLERGGAPSTKGHCFVIVATDYFTKWTEVIPLKNMTHKEVIEFITEHIIHRFGIPQTITTDQGTSFVAKEVCDFVNSYGIKLLNSHILCSS
jgi:hypothetical protein